MFKNVLYLAHQVNFLNTLTELISLFNII